jgi:hypothetical protein
MTEVSATNLSKKKNNLLTKIILTLALIFFSYIGFNYWKSSLAKKILAQHEAQKFDNIESDIFDLSDNHEATRDENLSEINVNELREKGAEFIYHLLIKNQTQISELNARLQTVEDELIKHKNREKIGKIILTYVELRQEIFTEKDYANSLKNFEILAALDPNLSSKVEKLKSVLSEFSSQEKLSKSFADIIPELIVSKKNNSNSSLISKIRHNISKLVIIRKIDGKNTGEIDSVIVRIEKSLKEENYQEAMNLMLSLDKSYHNIIADFLDDLSSTIEVQKIDQEILTYLKSLT